MVEISVGSGLFAAVCLFLPLVMWTSPALKRFGFMAVNMAVFFLSCKSPAAAVAGTAYILIPYYAAPLLSDSPEMVNNGNGGSGGNGWKKGMFIILMVLAFLYLMHYEWIIPLRLLPYSDALRIVGLSYFLFRQTDYIIQYDYFREENLPVSLTDYLNYMLSVYTVMAGPIMRYEEFIRDFYDEGKTAPDLTAILHQFQRILTGYMKVYIISSILSALAGRWFEKISETDTVFKAVLIFLVFAVFNAWYIYFNFSGYCDIVIGAAALSGLSVRENFNAPYTAFSISDFWKRHHITLSEWIRDYIYSPLSMALMGGPFKKAVSAGQSAALFSTFLLAGIWHGNTVNYVVYGLLQGLGIVVSHLRERRLKKKLGKKEYARLKENPVWRAGNTLLTLGFICISFSFVGYDVCALFTAAAAG